MVTGMKVTFLDIDGVLNNTQHAVWLHENVAPGAGFGQPWELDVGNITLETLGWDMNNVNALMHIVEQTDTRIVISSTWRIGRRVPFFRECFAALELRPLIIGVTPVLRNIGTIRGDEVAEWLNVRGTGVESFVCIDDDSDFHDDQPLVHVNNSVGLTMENAEEAIDILLRR
jgi:hypothetical protein